MNVGCFIGLIINIGLLGFCLARLYEKVDLVKLIGIAMMSIFIEYMLVASIIMMIGYFNIEYTLLICLIINGFMGLYIYRFPSKRGEIMRWSSKIVTL